MHSKDQILLENAYKTIRTEQNIKHTWNISNVKRCLQERGYFVGERVAKKDNIVIELRETLGPFLCVKITHKDNQFTEKVLGGSTPCDTQLLNDTLDEVAP